MIVPPFAAPSNFTSALHATGEKEKLWFIFSKGELLVKVDEGSVPDAHSLNLLRVLYMGTLGDKHLFAGEIDVNEPAPQGWIWSPVRALHGIMSEEHFALAGRALFLLDWDRTNTYCGCCGNLTFPREKERCRECRTCGHLAYPKMAPAVMVLVKKENKILLARSPHFPEKLYSVLAGFVDPGETIEQCVAREVFEEVGLKVCNVRYFGSQPWPFSYSLMIGFICDWQEGEICIDPSEIEDATWFERSHLPQIPTPLSLARLLIDD